MIEEILTGDRTTLARAITLVESTRADHRERARQLVQDLLPHSGKAVRVGVSGVPGAGKSTFLDALGIMLTDRGHRVAVLAVDPSSQRTGGSILGDKTRMARLAVDPNAFIRPSPSAGTLGGVARATRETMVLVEAAGFDVVLVETVGVGQSEAVVADMVDTFLVLMLARTGDSLQGIKKGILEVADVLAVNKADGDGALPARRSARELADALRMMEPASRHWQPRVLTCAGLTGEGLAEVWQAVLEHQGALGDAGELDDKRAAQQVRWMWQMVRDRLLAQLSEDVRGLAPTLEEQVRAGSLAASVAADELLEAFRG